MIDRKPPFVLAYLLTLLALLMTVHLMMLLARDQGCREYERTLLSRLLRVPPASPEARNIRNEIQNFFDGRYTDCSSTNIDFAGAADKYLAVILSLLTGAGVASGIRLKEELTKPPPLSPEERDDEGRSEDA